MGQPPQFTPTQLRAYEVLQRIRMAWLTLCVVLALFSIGLLSFLYAVFWLETETGPKLILGGIDLLLGLALREIIAYLFPNQRNL